MSEQIETVFVLWPNGPVRVNATDYRADMGPICDAEGNMLAPAAAPVIEAPAAAPVIEAPAAAPVIEAPAAAPVIEAPAAAPAPSYGVEKSGRKFYIVNSATGERIETAGYASDGEAWAAIMGLATAQ